MEIEDAGGSGTGLYYMTCALVDMTTRAFSNIWGNYYETMRAASDQKGKRMLQSKVLLCEATEKANDVGVGEASSNGQRTSSERLDLKTPVSEVVLAHSCVHGFMGENLDVGVHALKEKRFEQVKGLQDRVAGVDCISVQQLHLRLGHAVPIEEARRALLAGAYAGVSLRKMDNVTTNSKCMGCALGGMRRGPMNPQSESLKERMSAPPSANKWKGAVHGSADTFGPVPVKGVSGESYIFGCVVNYPYTFAFPYPIVDKTSATCDKCFAQMPLRSRVDQCALLVLVILQDPQHDVPHMHHHLLHSVHRSRSTFLVVDRTFATCLLVLRFFAPCPPGLAKTPSMF